MQAGNAMHQHLSFVSTLVLQTDKPGSKPDFVEARVTYNDFFSMFDVPFQYGGPWGKDADQNAEQVVVLDQEYNDKLFGGTDSVGKEIILDNRRFRVVGVIKKWAPVPKFYDL